MNKKIINLYASEFTAFLKKKNIDLDNFNSEGSKIIEKIKSDDLIKKYLNSPAIDSKKKIDLIKSFSKDENISLLLSILGKRSRLEYIVEIIEEIATISKLQSNIKEVIVTSVIKLNSEQINKVKDLVAKLFKSKTEIKNVISKAILGGLTIQIGDFLLDLSIKKQFDMMEKRILMKFK